MNALTRPAASATRRCPFAGACSYLDRPAERLVIDGFRLWIAGYQKGDIEHWSAAWNLYAAELGPTGGRAALSGLAAFVAAVLAWRVEPVRCFASGCPHVCRDECLAAAMIAACQHGDGECLAYCARAIAGVEDGREAMEAALGFAGLLRAEQRVLMPVPAHVVAGLVERGGAAAHHNPTFH